MAVALTLKVFKGNDLVASKDFDKDIIKIGRLSSAHLCLDDEKVSRIHSVIESGPDGTLSIIDMGSVEGTYVNGKRVNKGALVFGDEIKVGNTLIKLEAAAMVQAAANAIDATQIVAVPAGLNAEPSTDPAMAMGLRSAASVPSPAPAAVAAAPLQVQARSAIDDSFASTERNPTLAPLQEEGEPLRWTPPARRKGSGPLGAEIRLMWGDQMVATHFLAPGKAGAFTVGSAKGVDFVMGDGKLGGPSFGAVVTDGRVFTVRFTKKMAGEVVSKNFDQRMTLEQAIQKRVATADGDGYAISLENEDYVAVDLGGVRLEVFLQPQPRPVFVPWIETIDFAVLNVFLVMFFLGALFVITALNRDAEGDEYADELSGNAARMAKLIIKPPETKKNPLLERLAQQKEKQSGEKAAKSRGGEGQAGKKDSKQKNNRMAPKGDPSNKDIARDMTAKIFGKGGGGLSQVFGKNGLGGELNAAMGGLFGAKAGDSAGLGGLGIRGSGAGGGGTGDTIGIGGIGTKGRGGGTGSYGSGVGVLGGKKSVDVGISASDAIVQGSLDKELIRQVIRRNIGQIKYCYESQLTRFPKLSGKVAIKFIITGTGSVSSSTVAQSTANNAALETCVASRVRTWQFPKPKGGGVVMVTYPFVFKESGS